MQATPTPSWADPRPKIQSPLRHRRGADRDLAERLAEIRRLHRDAQQGAKADTLAHQAQEQQSWHATDPLPAQDLQVQSTHPFFQMEDMQAQLKWASGLSGDTKKVVMDQLEMSRKLGSTRTIAQAPEPSVLADLKRDFPTFDEVLQFIAQR